MCLGTSTIIENAEPKWYGSNEESPGIDVSAQSNHASGLLENLKSGWNNVLTEFEAAYFTLIKYLSPKVIWKKTLPRTTSAAAQDSSDIFE